MANPEQLEEQREETRLIIDELLEDGSDPDALYTIEHHLSADDLETLEKAAVEQLMTLAEKFDVEYDGWGTYFEDPNGEDGDDEDFVDEDDDGIRH